MTSITVESLPVAYRPKSFDDVVGQEAVVQVLRALVSRDTLPQQILFSGPSGTGKTTLARLTAAAMLCETSVGERVAGNPCGECSACRDILWPDRNHPDVMEIDAASNGRVDEIRELASQVQLMPQRAERRVVIIDEVHGLSASGGSAFLKLLEEPPAHVVFLLATTDPEKMLLTNRSRVTELPLRRPTPQQVAANLQRVAKDKGWNLPEQLAAAVVESTDPQLGVRGSLMTLQKIAPLLEEGEGNAKRAFELLGAATPAIVSELRNAYRTGNRQAAAEAARKATATASAATTLNALLRSTSKDVDAALESGNDAELAQALRDQEALIDAQATRKPLEWTVLHLALNREQIASPEPAPGPDPTPPAPQNPQAEKLLELLRQSAAETARFMEANTQLADHPNGGIVVTVSSQNMQALRQSPHANPLAQAANAVPAALYPNLTD